VSYGRLDIVKLLLERGLITSFQVFQLVLVLLLLLLNINIIIKAVKFLKKEFIFIDVYWV